MILACHNIKKSFGTDEIIKESSFHIEDHEKAAIVGINGAGKSTLLKMIMHIEESDSGSITIAKGKTIGYLAQHQDTNGSNTIYNEVLEVKRPVIEMETELRNMEEEMKTKEGNELDALMDSYSRLNHKFELNDGYSYKSEVGGVLKGLGFFPEDYNRIISTLSGGQKTRVALAKLLLDKPDIILLDEPTNHLDLNSIAWLENFLSNYQGAVVIVAHDRYFLNKIVTKIIEIDNGIITTFSGNYSDYSKKKAQLREAQIRQYLNQQREIKHQEAVIEKLKSFNREKSIRRAESREKALEKIEVIDKPVEVNSQMHIHLEPSIVSGNDVLSVKELSKSFPPLTLFSNVSFEIKRGERVAIIGDNGTGKTTLLKVLNNMCCADKGEFTLGTNVEIGYYDQEHHVLHMEKTLFEEISDAYPELTHTKIRNVLAAFLFTGDDVFKPISALSGGERGRLSLAKLMLSNANFLILDEPTNHLDMVSKEILENALTHYTGTVLYVSHDRYFINETATRILDLKNHNFINYIGNYDYYLEKNEELTKLYTNKNEQQILNKHNSSPSLLQKNNCIDSQNNYDINKLKDYNFNTDPNSGKLSWLQQKEAQAKRRKLENEYNKTEQDIALNEEIISSVDNELSKPEIATNSAKCSELSEKRNTAELKLAKLYEKWEELAEKLEL